MKRRLMKMAWSIAKNYSTFAEALTAAWRAIKLQCRLLTEPVVTFRYKKIDGSIREAVGTLETVPQTKGSDRAKNYGVINYFDITAQGWRSFKAENLIA